MNLGKSIASAILNEADIRDIVVIYPGRFQPMGKHHAEVYKKLASRFGKSNTYVATSDKVKLPKSPLDFSEKEQVINAHGITNVVQVRNPYQASEILGNYNPETTAVIFAVGKKDMDEDPRFRVGTKRNGEPTFFQYYDDNKGNLQPYTKHGYLYVAPHVSIRVPGYGDMSGTVLRQVLATASPEEFETVMGFYDDKIFNLLRDKFSVLVAEQIGNFVINTNIISEISFAGGSKADVDDGPRYFYGNQKTYQKKTAAMAERLGFKVMNYILNTDQELENYNDMWPNGPVDTVSYFPTGEVGAVGSGTNYTKELRGNPGYKRWQNYITGVAERVGYKFLNFLGAEEAIDSTEKEPMTKAEAALTESLTKEWWAGKFRTLITEGGASGHMNHPFDDRDLTFAEMKEMVRMSLQGELNRESDVTEKTDGQNLNVTFKDGKVGAARNKATIRQPMDIDAVKMKFGGRGDISDAFAFAMEDLEKAILALSPKQRDEMFQNGRRFVNLEIIYPATANVITYGPKAYLQFHGLNEFDLESATKTTSLPEYGGLLQKMISDVNADTQEHFKIIPPKVVTLSKLPDFDEKETYYINKINQLQKEYGLKDSDEVVMYHQRWWEDYIDSQLPDLSIEEREGLLRRWAYGDKSYRLNAKNIINPDTLERVLQIDKQDIAKLNKSNIVKFEDIFLELGAEVLSNASEFLSANPSDTVKDLRKQIADTVRELKDSDDLATLDKMKTQLKRIETAGGFKKLVPTEGIVFVYKGKTYKLTGLFAPVNQLLGLTRYSR
jgi:gas vesicle protein